MNKHEHCDSSSDNAAGDEISGDAGCGPSHNCSQAISEPALLHGFAPELFHHLVELGDIEVTTIWESAAAVSFAP